MTGPAYGRFFSNLQGAVNDAIEFAALLDSYEFERSNIRVLLEQEATARNILDTFRRHLIDASTCRGDISVFFYSGHGSEIRNVARPENSMDAFDQTLVPYDAADGTPDIRDKELVRLYAAAAKKGIILTVIADSCHSGGLSRGAASFARVKDLPPDSRYVNDKGIAEDPTRQSPGYEKPVLLLAAAFEKEAAREDDSGDQPHGALSEALLEKLRAHPPHESIGAIFSDVQAAVTARFADQHPQIFGEGRAALDLFGKPADSISGVFARFRRLSPSGKLLLDRGTAASVYPGCEFKSLASGAPGLRIRISEARLADSDAEVIAGSTGALRPGDRFKLDRWVMPEGRSLSVYFSKGPPMRDLTATAGALAQIESAGIRIVSDPTVETPKFQAWWIDGAWQLVTGDTGGLSQGLGTTLDAAALIGRIGRGDSLFVNFPLPEESASKLALGAGSANDSVRVQPKPGGADYVSAGRWSGKEFEYAWMVPGAIEEDQPKLNLPVRTDWVGGSAAGFEQQLVSKLLPLGRIKGWLMLALPGGGDRSAFPYRLALRKAGGTETPSTAGSQTRHGEQYKIWLTASKSDLAEAEKAGGLQQRWIYVLSLDAEGTVRLIVPSAEGNVANQAPEEGTNPTEIQVTTNTSDIAVEPPYGLDTLILLTTVDPIDPRVLPAEGVRTRTDARASRNPLADLLMNIGAGGRRRGPPDQVPLTWSVETLTLRSVEK